MLDVSRRELKYLVSLGNVSSLKRKLSEIMREDDHNGERGYLVRSLYFDSIYDRDFEDKVDGYDNRQKVRLRVYNFDSQTAKLELKEKSGIAQRKRSLLINRDEAECMIRGDYGFLLEREEEIANKLYTFMVTRCYRPKCIVEYDRIAFCEPVNDMRITFDMNLRATEAGLQGLFDQNLILYPVCDKSEVTMEVKYKEADAAGITYIWWDNGENYRIMDREKYEWTFPEIKDVLIKK